MLCPIWGFRTVAFTVLAARPIATAMVYFSDKQCRDELLDVGTLSRKFWRRLSAGVRWFTGAADPHAGDRVRFVPEPSVQLFDRDGGRDGDEAGGAPYELMLDDHDV